MRSRVIPAVRSSDDLAESRSSSRSAPTPDSPLSTSGRSLAVRSAPALVRRYCVAPSRCEAIPGTSDRLSLPIALRKIGLASFAARPAETIVFPAGRYGSGDLHCCQPFSLL